ncbi:uncharacterized protein LOC123469599 [Daphnia magna]|uniref:uncharacterized protein LOC123469599 n=1 Tax=Daphnia magna TaxID=35525 RepID=UPI001E1BC25F|nr:uncharacterized protein LOC123469599 [Daphnia magna]
MEGFEKLKNMKTFCSVAPAAIENKFDNSADVAFKPGIDNVHILTINRRLIEAGIKSEIGAVKDILTDEHRAGRLAFVRWYVNQPIDFWRIVVFTDEKSWSSSSRGGVRVRRLKKERSEKRNILNIKRSGRTFVSVWGGMWSGGLTRLSRVERNLTTVQYVNTLKTNLIAFIRANFQRGERITFVQDNSRIHTAVHTRTWLGFTPNLFALELPTKGCDMNPIENL